MVWACREKIGRLCSEESRPDGEKANNSRQRKTQKDYKRGYPEGSRT